MNLTQEQIEKLRTLRESYDDMVDVLNFISTAMYKGIPIVQQTESDVFISPNVWNVWGEVGTLNITKGNTIEGILNTYLIRFTATESTSVTFNDFALKWKDGAEPVWGAGLTYEINIVDNLALFSEFK